MICIAEYFDLITTGENEITSENTNLNITIYPSPFSENTNLSYFIAERSFVNIEIFNINGRQISTLVNEVQQQGEQKVVFDGTGLPAGIYFCQLKINNSLAGTRKMIVLK